MMILTVENEAIDTDSLTEERHFAVLSFRDYKEPDFYMDQKTEYLEEFSSASIVLRIGPYEAIMPLHWSILCTDMEYVQTVPLQEVSGRNFTVFCLNPIDGYRPHYHELKTGMIFPNTTWTCPPISDKDMLFVPLHNQTQTYKRTIMEKQKTVAGDIMVGREVEMTRKGGIARESENRGPLCAIFSPSKLEVYKPISDIW